MRLSYLFVLVAFMLTTSCQKESVNDAINTADLPVFEGRSLVVSVVSTNPSHCTVCNHSTNETTPQPVQDARVALYDPINFKQGDALPLASFDSNANGVARFDDLELEAYEVVVIYGGKEYGSSSQTPENEISRLTIEME